MAEITFDVNNFHIPRWDELPNIDLYMDQVLNYIEGCLKDYIKLESNEKIITKTMVNNYVKQDIILPPVNKKYNKLHIAELFAICILKQVYSISEIKELLNLALSSNSAENSYNKFCDYLTESLISTFNGTEYSSKPNLTKEQYLLKNVVQSFANKLYVQMTYLNK